MKVEYVSVTGGTVREPLKEGGTEEEHDNVTTLSAEELIAYTARVSNPTNQLNVGSTAKLLGYLIRNKHWSPFEMVSFTLAVTTSRGIAAQILRHRSFSFQEFSQRYAQALNREIYQARRQDSKNRQNSIDDMSFEDQQWFLAAQDKVWNDCNDLYTRAIEKGIAKEQARFLLPLGTETKIYMCGTARSWIHYFQVRDAEGVQKEHRDIAIEGKKIFKQYFPATSEALEW